MKTIFAVVLVAVVVVAGVVWWKGYSRPATVPRFV